MEYLMRIFLIVLALVLHGTKTLSEDVKPPPLVYGYYKEICPFAEEIIRRQVGIAVLKEPRMAASLLRLHFHDCFVLGCDASLLLDSFGEIVSEKQAGPNLNSVRGFEVIDDIKFYLEKSCPCTVSCADILAIAARDAVELRGGPRWEVLLGRRDSLEASLSGANQFIPPPNSSLETLIASFHQKGLDVGDLIALSGSHTIGNARCSSFRQRVYEVNFFEEHDRYKRYTTFRRILRSICPESGKDHRLAPLDLTTPARFDNFYFQNLLQGEGLLGSDIVLISQDHEGEILRQVLAYASDEKLFFDSFAKSMVKMGNINVLTGDQGEIRKHCRHLSPQVYGIITLLTEDQVKVFRRHDYEGSLQIENVQALASKNLKEIPPCYLLPEAELDQASVEIPVIDMRILLDQNPLIHQDELEKLYLACKDRGLNVAFTLGVMRKLINHGVQEEVVEKIKIDTKGFFPVAPGEEESLFSAAKRL